MDWLHTTGVSAISWLQTTFVNHSKILIFFSMLGDPRNAFLLYFPISYHFNNILGCQVLWVAAISEWINTALKWFLHGERPYWWVHETEHEIPHAGFPSLTHYQLTCETGPGSPSGHMMVTTAVACTLLVSANKYLRKWMRVALCVALLVFLSVIGLSRCFIATHFPHQVILGAAVGVLIAAVFAGLKVSHLTLIHYILISTSLLFIGLGIFGVFLLCGMDPLWSMYLAERWCSNAEWVHHDTTLLYSLLRDSSALLGLGLGMWISSSVKVHEKEASLWYHSLTAVISIACAQGCEFIQLPKYVSSPVFYTFSAVKNISVIFTIVVVRIFLKYLYFGPTLVLTSSSCSSAAKIR